MSDETAPKRRFADKVDDYVKYRPTYPEAAIDWLEDRGTLVPGVKTADIGAGTGIWTDQLRARGFPVWAVEPNDPMRQVALDAFAGSSIVSVLDGAAEHTKLPESTFELITAAQAFHWFDPVAARTEFERILTDDGQVALLWNTRRTEGEAFLEDYESLIVEFGTDYTRVDHRKARGRVADFFGGESAFEYTSFRNARMHDFEGVRGRLESCSYIPTPDHERYNEMIAALRDLFDEHEHGGDIEMKYDTEIFVGRFI
ncbi:MAG: class I SAM-dependent methyltransferase [Myxococcota bacterium]